MERKQRNTTVDIIRTVALFGICIVNLPFLGVDFNQQTEVSLSMADKTVIFLVESLFQNKFFLLFSFIFGWGFQVQINSAKKNSINFSKRYFRRLIGLAALGFLHAFLVFAGDILILYAILGLFLWPFRNTPSKILLRISLCIFPVGLITLIGLGHLMTTWEPLINLFQGKNSHLGGTYPIATLGRFLDWPATFSFIFLYQGPLAFGAFLVGLSAAKSDFFEKNSVGQQTLSTVFPWLLIISIPASFYLTQLPEGDNSLLSLLRYFGPLIIAPIMTAVYLHILLLISDKINLPKLIVRAGQNSLSCYVLQGLIAGLIFGGYGFKYYGELNHSALLLLSILITFTSILLTSLMASYWTRAPLEKLLRYFTNNGFLFK
tara:strand:+ start:3442 stop:4569 length:1128 start_codon:yes stop_codon:yes gene_type:complete